MANYTNNDDLCTYKCSDGYNTGYNYSWPYSLFSCFKEADYGTNDIIIINKYKC